ncbi:unnamed protein product [Fraxinus pennsylvanica]|uniref:Protein kinase domain-containing protein n=1 Tax=Fraxinus pennsylvanica TaxID=56036 RepID=A0AAD2E6A9_9LAMI|nr:unnamed protein product [Fraxinus pennsylvanica]
MRVNIMKGVAKCLVYLHEYSPKKYVRGDLEPSNILIGHDIEPKLSDFGLGLVANIAGGSPTLQSSGMVSEKPQHRQQGSTLTDLFYREPIYQKEYLFYDVYHFSDDR